MRNLGIARSVSLLAAVAVCVAVSGCGPSQGLEPAPELPGLRIGMSIGEAKQQLGGDFLLPYWESTLTSGCSYFQIKGNDQIGGMVIDKRVATVSFSQKTTPDGYPAEQGPPTLRGLRPGDSISRAIELFGRPDRIAGSEVSIGADLYWQLAEQEGRNVFLRASLGSYLGASPKELGHLEVGIEPSIFYYEGCA
jgi:hypothetical protein